MFARLLPAALGLALAATAAHWVYTTLHHVAQVLEAALRLPV